jgi:hypothetical protein
VAHTVSSCLVAILLAGAAVLGFEATITPRLVNEAVLLGESRIDSARTRFHQPYRLQVARAPIDYIDVVTPFRRIVLLTEERTRLGIRGFTQHDATAALADHAGIVELHVEMTFHPQNVFVGVPEYDVELVAASPPAARLTPQSVSRIPRFGARIDAAPLSSPSGAPPNQPGGGGMPLTGGTIVAAFPVGSVNGTGVYDVVVSDAGKELARARVNFGGLR